MAAIPETVHPGDVISSDLLNRIIRLLNQHDALLAGSTGPLDISRVSPPVVRMGEELKVFGSGLEPSTLKRISVDGTDVRLDTVNLGSNDGLLALNVPAILGVSDTGKTVVLTVENKAGASDFESFYVLPGIATDLEASFNITRTTVSPAGALAANTSYEFTFSIEAFTSRDETYLLEPRLLNPSPGWSVVVKGGASEMFIRKSQPTPSTTPVVLVVTTGAAESATLALGLRAKNFGNKTGSSMAEPLSIGVAPPAPNLDVRFMSPTVVGPDNRFTNGSLYVKASPSNPATQRAIVSSLNVELTNPGVYTIGAPLVSDPRWTVRITNSPTSFDTTGTPSRIESVRFTAAAEANAPDADAEIPITGAGALPDGSFKFKLKLRPDPSNPSPI